MEPVVADEALQGQAHIWQNTLNFADSMVLKCAIELRIADIINSHGSPITLSQIASNITSSSAPNLGYLARIMRLLVRNKIFTATPTMDGGDTLYGLTHSSKWLIHDREMSLDPNFFLVANDIRLVAPLHYLGTCVREGGDPFEKAHGCGIFEYSSAHPEFSAKYNGAMKSASSFTMAAAIASYKEGFEGIGTLIDVGGGIGAAIAKIVEVHPHIKGINYDLPHVIATAPEHEGVSHVGGNMFEAIPSADAIFMKWILHDWSDEDCVKILKNCRKAIPEKNGKVIIVDVVLQPDGNDLFDKIGVIFDLIMMAHTPGGKERTEFEWKELLEKGGFLRCNIIKIPGFLSIIEAFPK